MDIDTSLTTLQTTDTKSIGIIQRQYFTFAEDEPLRLDPYLSRWLLCVPSAATSRTDRDITDLRR